MRIWNNDAKLGLVTLNVVWCQWRRASEPHWTNIPHLRQTGHLYNVSRYW